LLGLRTWQSVHESRREEMFLDANTGGDSWVSINYREF